MQRTTPPAARFGAHPAAGPEACDVHPCPPGAAIASPSLVRDRRLARLAAEQDGIVTRRQLLDAGFTARTIERRVERGALWRQLRGVYAVGHPVTDRRRRLRAALLAAGPDAWLSHHTAAELLGLIQKPDPSRPVEVTVLDRRRRSQRDLVVHSTRRLERADRMLVDGLPITAPERTLVDLAGRVDRRRLDRMVNAAQIATGVRPSALLAAIDRAPGRPTTVLRELVSAAAGVRRSGLESDLWRHLRVAGLTDGARCNVALGPWEVDVVWEDARVVVETDGFRYHRTRADRERDERKARWLRARGYELLRFSDDDIARRPTAAVAEVAGALAVARRGAGR